PLLLRKAQSLPTLIREEGMKSPRSNFDCPVCGETVPAQAKACPACGACDKSGWSGDASGGLDLPDDDFDYDAFLESEGLGRKAPAAIKLWAITAAILLVALLITTFGGCWRG
ncbi:MAG: hypothetical protein ABI680_06470, partial [Chthoniobacteraceae bacterium]